VSAYLLLADCQMLGHHFLHQLGSVESLHWRI